MRVLALCKMFPLASGTRALQMANVVAALESHGIDIHVISNVDQGRLSIAEAFRKECKYGLDYVPTWTPSASTSTFKTIVNRLGATAARLSMDAMSVARTARLARAAIESHRPDIILTVAVPTWWHRVGLRIRRVFPTLSWAAFYSDPRPACILPKPYDSHSLRSVQKMRQNREILRAVDAVIAPSRYLLDLMEASLGVDLTGRRYVIPHCGSRVSTPPVSPDIGGWLLHVGTLTRERVTDELLKATKNVAGRYPCHFKGLMCVGPVARDVVALVRSLEMSDRFRTVGVLPAEEACSLAASADANLVAEAPMHTSCFLPSKFADCAVNGRPILAVTPRQSAIRDYLESRGGGIAVTHRQVEIEHALEALFVKKQCRLTSEAAALCRGNTTLAEPFLPTSVAKEYSRVFRAIIRAQAAA